jgi:phage baseplate assembly protein W
MPLIAGSVLSHPFRPDIRGTLTTTQDSVQIVKESIQAILETRQGERVMLPDYGIPDYVFAVMDAGFVPRLAYFVQQQVLNYEPLCESVSVAWNNDPTVLDQQQAEILVTYKVRGANTEHNFVWPVWQLAV